MRPRALLFPCGDADGGIIVSFLRHVRSGLAIYSFLLSGGNLTNSSLFSQAVMFCAPQNGYSIRTVTAVGVITRSADGRLRSNCIPGLAFGFSAP